VCPCVHSSVYITNGLPGIDSELVLIVNGIFIVCFRIDKGDVLAIESKQVIEMKEGNTIAPYTFRRVSTNSRVREVIKMLLKKIIISLIPKLFLVYIKKLHVSQSEEVLYQLLNVDFIDKVQKTRILYADQLSTISYFVHI